LNHLVEKFALPVFLFLHVKIPKTFRHSPLSLGIDPQAVYSSEVMPDQPYSSTTPPSPAAPDELNLVDPVADKPRLKRRNLKARPATSAAALANGEPLPDSPRAEHPPLETPASAPSPATSATPASSYSLPTTPLYYTTGVPKTKEDASTMKTNSPSGSSTPRPASAAPVSGMTSSSPTRPASSATSSAYQARPAASATGASSFSSARPASSASASSAQARPAAASVTAPNRASSVNDFRSNAERQAREQKSMGDIISIIVYTLVGFVVLGTILAGYGAYVITRQIHKQSMTLSDIDSRYTAENHALALQLQATNDSLARSVAQIARQQELLNRQQDALNKLANAAEANTAAWREERQARAAEAASMRARIRDLEDEPRFSPVNH
jgi:cell division protein FtsB